MSDVGRIFMGLLLAVSTSPSFAADDFEAYRDGYQDGDYGRVRFLEGGAAIQRGTMQNEAGDTVTANTPVFPGDTVYTQGNQRAEVQLAGGTLVRLDRGTDVQFQALPRAQASPTDNAILKLAQGTLQVSATIPEDGDFRVDTPSASIFLLSSGDFRIEVGANGRTRVQSRRGVAEVSSTDGSVLVRGGMRSVAYPGSVPEDPRPFNAFAVDEFDRWTAEREQAITSLESAAQVPAGAYRAIPNEIQPYYRELAAYGTWLYLPTYGYAWYPHSRGIGWRPYLDGYWHYGPAGYFWVSSEPWGWAPYHYGRWSWAAGHGWCWIPGSVFSGAWVSWSWGTTHVGWCPLDYWNHPAFIGPVYNGFYDPYSWTFVSYNHIVVRDCKRYAVPVERLGHDLQTHVVLTRAPRVAPRALARDASAREGAYQAAVRDRHARVASMVGRDHGGRRTFSELEKAARRDAVSAPRPRVNVPGSRRSGLEDTRLASPPGRTATRGPTSPSSTPHEQRSRTSFEPRSKTPTSPRRRSDETPPARQSGERFSGNRGTLGEAGNMRDAGDRVRDMYRRMASPRVARERGTAPSEAAPRNEPPHSGQPRVRNAPRTQVPPVPPPRSARSQSAPTPKPGNRAPGTQGPRRQAGASREGGKEGKKK